MTDNALKTKKPAKIKLNLFILLFCIVLIILPNAIGLVNLLLSHKDHNKPALFLDVVEEIGIGELLYIVVTGILFYYFFLFIISLFTLPINLSEANYENGSLKRKGKLFESFKYLLDFIQGRSGPVVTIEKGEELNRKPEKRNGATIALLDNYSAAVFLPGKFQKAKKKKKSVDEEDSKPLIVVPGVNFIKPGRKLYGTVDLRPQFKTMSVTGHTQDGVELTTELFVTFSLTPLEEKWVIISGGKAHYIELKKDTFSIPKRKIITLTSKFVDDVTNNILLLRYEQNLLLAKNQSKITETPSLKANVIPFFVEKRCIEAAVLSHQEAEKELRDWREIPGQIAQKIFQECLAEYRFDDLFGILDPKQVFIKYFRSIYRTRMISQGVNLIRFVYPFRRPELKVGDVITTDEIRISPPILLGVDPGMEDPISELAKRGISILDAGFTDLVPNVKMQENIIKTLQERSAMESFALLSEIEKNIRARRKIMRLSKMFPEVANLYEEHSGKTITDLMKKNTLKGELGPITDRLFKAGLISLKEANDIISVLSKI